MKKSLIALSVLVAAGAAVADASITGRIDAGYLAWSNANGTQTSGLGVDKSEIYFITNEKISADQILSVQLGLGGLDRSMVTDPKSLTPSTSVTGRDTFIAYTNTSLGRIQLGNTTAKNYFSNIATAAAPVIDFDGKLFETRSPNDYISYALAFGPVSLVAIHNEPSKGLGIGQGSQWIAPNSQTNNTLTALYNQGPLMAALSYRAYNSQKMMANQTYLGTKDHIINTQISYDFGIARLGGGYQRAKGSSGTLVDDYLVGLSVPMGALTLGGTYAGSRAYNVPTGSAMPGWDLSKYEGSKNGYSLGASYALSKNTSVAAKFAAWKYSGYVAFERDGAAGGGNGTAGLGDGMAVERSVILSHTF